MRWPQITYICLIVSGVVINLVKNGESRGKYNAGMALLAAGIEIGLLYAGGFFE